MAVDSEEDTACTRCLERGEECMPGGGTTKACAQCRQVKGKCSLVKKAPAATLMPTKARKRPRIEDAGSAKVLEVQEKEQTAREEVRRGKVSAGRHI